MPTVGEQFMTITDYANLLDPDGSVADIVNTLAQTNEILDDMIWKEGNLLTGEKHSILTGLPKTTWREMYGGIKQSKASRKQVTDTCGVLEALSKVDVELTEIGGNPKAVRAAEDDTFLEAMSEELGTAIFYYSTKTNPERMLGFFPRYNQLPTQDKHNDFRDNVIDGGGTGSTNTSIMLACWGPRTGFGIFPKGTKAGLMHEDLGKLLTQAEDGSGEFLAWVSHFKWRVGLATKNWKYFARIPNIDVTNLKANPEPTDLDIVEKMITAYYRLPRANQSSKMVFYANATIAEYLHHQARNKVNVNLRIDEVDGKPITKCLGIPIKRCDAILNTEEAVTTTAA